MTAQHALVERISVFEMNKILNAEMLNISKMASGHLCLNITENVNWDDFPEYANKLIKILNGELLSKVDATDVRIWEITINNHKFNLTYDDYPIMVALESSDDNSDNEIVNIQDILLNLKNE